MSLSKEQRLSDMQQALALMLKELGPRAIDRIHFDPAKTPFTEIQNTTWLELKRECYIEPEQYVSGTRYRLSGRGWLAGLEIVGELDHLKTQMAQLMGTLKRSVKGRNGPAVQFLDSLAMSAGVSVDFAYNVIESDAIGIVLGRQGVAWEHRRKMIRINEDFGLELL